MRSSHIGVLAVVGVVVVGWALVSIGSSAPAETETEAVSARESASERPGPGPGLGPRLRPRLKKRIRLDAAHQSRAQQQRIEPPPPTPGQISADESLDAFNLALDAMDQARDAGRTSRKRKRELYAQATDAFTVLSTHLDGRDPQQRAVLEKAHRDMMERMEALDLKVPRRPGAVLEPSGR